MVMDFEKIVPMVAGKKRDTAALDKPQTDQLRARVLEARARAVQTGTWMLESRTGDGDALQRAPIQPLPFRVGRAAELELVLASPYVSKTHAEIYSDGEALRVRDLGSHNGTFLNRQPVSDAALHHGDVLHFGDREFRIGGGDGSRSVDDDTGTLIRRGPLPKDFETGARDLRDLLNKGSVTMVFQPIVDMPTSRVSACEALGRGRHPGLPKSPVELFDIAAQLGCEAQVELSRLFRRRAVEMVKDLPEPPQLFLNTHPAELVTPGLVESLEELRALAPGVDLVLEIHESALAQTDFIVWLRTRLMEINVGLAYDDFGAGQARLFELAEAPPHYLKFDRRFVTGIDHAPVSRQRLVASLVAAARELLVRTVAEGVETAEEAAACMRAGFTHAQGYHFGRPGPVDKALAEVPVSRGSER
jgi:EAL domain-containing protein (putative c-di-GMP-specific phosphodiesterase class I)